MPHFVAFFFGVVYDKIIFNSLQPAAVLTIFVRMTQWKI